MPAQTPQEFLQALQSGGALIVRNGDFYFVPDTVLGENRQGSVFGGPKLKGPGILLVRKDVVHFIPQAILDSADSKLKFPEKLSKGSTEVSPLYFTPDDGSPDSRLANFTTVGKVWREFRNILAAFPALDGFSQAIFVPKAEDLVGKNHSALGAFDLLDGVSNAVYLVKVLPEASVRASKSERMKENVFVYHKPTNRILVSLVKGGRPSDR